MPELLQQRAALLMFQRTAASVRLFVSELFLVRTLVLSPELYQVLLLFVPGAFLAYCLLLVPESLLTKCQRLCQVAPMLRCLVAVSVRRCLLLRDLLCQQV